MSHIAPAKNKQNCLVFVKFCCKQAFQIIACNEAICQRFTGFACGSGFVFGFFGWLFWGVCDSQLYVIRKSSQGEVQGSQSAANKVKSGNHFWSLCCHDVYADITAQMSLPLVVFLRYFRFDVSCILKKNHRCPVSLTVSVVCPSSIVFDHVSAGGVYCARGMCRILLL